MFLILKLKTGKWTNLFKITEYIGVITCELDLPYLTNLLLDKSLKNLQIVESLPKN